MTTRPPVFIAPDPKDDGFVLVHRGITVLRSGSRATPVGVTGTRIIQELSDEYATAYRDARALRQVTATILDLISKTPRGEDAHSTTAITKQTLEDVLHLIEKERAVEVEL